MPKPSNKELSASLGEALNPPRVRKPARAVDLGEYDDGRDTVSPSTTSRGVTPPNPTEPLAPARDFNKRANSLDKLALPAGLFPGSSQKLYNALYVRTRGAIVPTRNITATKRELSEWSGIRNVKTIDSHLRYFSAIGLVVSEWHRGQNEGSTYEVFLPEETSGIFSGSRGVTPPNPMSLHVIPPDVELPQNLGSPHHQNLGSPHLTKPTVESTTSNEPKTFIKTNTNDDDDALGEFTAIIENAVQDITGRGLSATEKKRWAEVAEVLATELKIAAGRTTISSAPAFLAEHLRRRLFKKDKRQIEAEASEPQAASGAKVDAAKCPDCYGTGMWYPEGYEKGVVKCQHEKLSKGE